MTEERKPVVAFYCATFLKPEMLHIYRQITGLELVEPFVIAQKRENAGAFPFDKMDIVRARASAVAAAQNVDCFFTMIADRG